MKNLFLGLLTLLIVSCSTTVDFNIPASRFHTPETSGKALTPGLLFGYGVSHEYELASISSAILFDDTYDANISTGIDKSSGLAFHGYIGVLDDIDIYYNTFYDSVSTFGLKWQFLGDASSEGHKLSVMGGYGQGSEDKSGSHINISSSSSRSYNTSLELSAFDIELLYGYRWNKYALTYANLNYNGLSADAKLSSSDFENERVKGNVKTGALLIGVEFSDGSKSTGAIIETGVSVSQWEDSVSKTIFPIGASVFYQY